MISIPTDSIPADIDKWIRDNLFNAVPMAIAVIDRRFNVVHANTAFGQMFGGWHNRKCFSVYKDRDAVCEVCKGRGVFEDGVPRVNEEIGLNKKGALTHYIQHTLPVRDAAGEVVYLVEIATDITEIEQIRKEHRLLFDQVPCNVLVINRDFRIVRANRQLHRTLGDIEGQQCYRALKGYDHKCDECTARKTFSDGDVHSGSHVWAHGNGEIAHLLVTTVPLRQADGSFDLVMEMAVDVTETVKLEQDKLEAERMAAVGQTVAGLAHGIKNIINALEGGMYLLKSGIDQNRTDRVSNGMDMLLRNIGRVSMFVREFLSFSKGREIHVKMEDPPRVAREVVELYSADAGAHGIELRSETPAPILPAPMDYEGMHECLTNLVGNAIDACNMSGNPGGRIVTVRTFEQDDTIIFEVIDNGCGMDYEVKQKVFTNFFTTKGLGGAGLGLLTTKKIVQEHGGEIEFESEPSKGSTFRIRLPRKRLPKTMEKAKG